MITIYILIFTFTADHKLAIQEQLIHSLFVIVVNDKYRDNALFISSAIALWDVSWPDANVWLDNISHSSQST